MGWIILPFAREKLTVSIERSISWRFWSDFTIIFINAFSERQKKGMMGRLRECVFCECTWYMAYFTWQVSCHFAAVATVKIVNYFWIILKFEQVPPKMGNGKLCRPWPWSDSSFKRVGWLCWGLTSLSTIFQSCRDGAIASWVINQYFRGVKCLAQGHNTAEVGLEPRTSRSGVRHSTTEPPRSPSREWFCTVFFCLSVLKQDYCLCWCSG